MKYTSTYQIRGFIHPANEFHTIKEWQDIAKIFLMYEKQGYDVRGGNITDNSSGILSKLINTYFGYLYNIDTYRYPNLINKRMVLDFIEDFVNHRAFHLNNEFNEVLGNELIKSCKIAWFYSRGQIEPYIQLNDEFTNIVYGSLNIPIHSYHWTTEKGFENINTLINTGKTFELSTFTKQEKMYFVKQSYYLIELQGNLVAAFHSDCKSLLLDDGTKAANLTRIGYPSNDNCNLCWDVNEINDTVETGLWNEIIIKPIQLISCKKIMQYQ